MYCFLQGETPILIDTGLGTGDLLPVVKDLFGKEPTVLLTHSHGDHIGGIHGFSDVYAGEEDLDAIDPEHTLRSSGILRSVSSGHLSKPGCDRLEIISLPGHTPGARGYLDHANRRFFGGDIVSFSPVYMCLPGADIKAWRQSLLEIAGRACQYDELYVGHEEEPIPRELISEYIVLANIFLNGHAESVEDVFFDRYPCRRYFYGNASILV